MSGILGRSDGVAAVALAALAAATRWPLAGSTLGEPDGARYALGLEQWLRAGRQAPIVYGRVLSPGYYALAAWLTRTTGAAPLHVLDAISLLAAIAGAPLIYLFGRRLCGPAVAATGTVLFLLAPGFWWLGIEPHPQGASFLLLLVGVVAFLALNDWRGEAVAAVCFGAGLLLKNDLVLVAGLFPALRLMPEERASASSPGRWRRAMRSLWVPAAGSAIFLVGRSWILGMAMPQAQRQTMAAVERFLSLPHGVDLIKQVLPMVTSAGLATTTLIAMGLVVGILSSEWRRRWGWPLLGWSAPAAVFWFLIHGNNVRHMAPVVLVPLWAAVDAFVMAATLLWIGRHRVASIAVRGVACASLCGCVLAANWMLPPASSDMTLYPSGNVPGSVADLAARSHEMKVWLRTGMADHGRAIDPCILGNGTLPYLEFDLLHSEPHDEAVPLTGIGTSEAMTIAAGQGGGMARFVEVNSPTGDRRAEQQCARIWSAPSLSLEYTPGGVHRRFLGREWTWLPLAKRWYPAPAMQVNVR